MKPTFHEKNRLRRKTSKRVMEFVKQVIFWEMARLNRDRLAHLPMKSGGIRNQLLWTSGWLLQWIQKPIAIDSKRNGQPRVWLQPDSEWWRKKLDQFACWPSTKQSEDLLESEVVWWEVWNVGSGKQEVLKVGFKLDKFSFRIST